MAVSSGRGGVSIASAGGEQSRVWLKVGIPALVLVVLIAARLIYYVFWRRHWDGRPVGSRRGEGAETEVIVIRAPEPPSGGEDQ